MRYYESKNEFLDFWNHSNSNTFLRKIKHRTDRWNEKYIFSFLRPRASWSRARDNITASPHDCPDDGSDEGTIIVLRKYFGRNNSSGPPVVSFPLFHPWTGDPDRNWFVPGIEWTRHAEETCRRNRSTDASPDQQRGRPTGRQALSRRPSTSDTLIKPAPFSTKPSYETPSGLLHTKAFRRRRVRAGEPAEIFSKVHRLSRRRLAPVRRGGGGGGNAFVWRRKTEISASPSKTPGRDIVFTVPSVPTKRPPAHSSFSYRLPPTIVRVLASFAAIRAR